MDQGYATTKTRPLRRDAERNRLLILRAARTVFAHRGLDATLDEVAKEAGLGVGTVYRRFPNRDALIDALFDDGMEEITRIAAQAEAEPRAWDGLRRFMTELVQLQTADRGLRDVMLCHRLPASAVAAVAAVAAASTSGPGASTSPPGTGSSPASPAPSSGHELIRERLKPPLEHLVHRAQQEGDLRPDLTATDIGVLEVAVLGTAEFTAVAAPDAWRRFLTIVLDGMRATRDPSPLPTPPLDVDQIDACMVGWKYGSRDTPRQRLRGVDGVDGVDSDVADCVGADVADCAGLGSANDAAAAAAPLDAAAVDVPNSAVGDVAQPAENLPAESPEVPPQPTRAAD